MAELDPQMDYESLVDDLAQHVMDQTLPLLERALKITPDGLEAALILRFFFKCVSTTSGILPFKAWKTMSPESRVRALVKILEASLQEDTAFEISNHEIRVVSKRMKKRGH
jgi:hypothetical protein